jgi:uncharacterized SAM-binding protein YcdF (DUF218 family)
MFSVLTSLLANLFLWLWLLCMLLLWWATRGNRRTRRVGYVLAIAVWLLGTRPVAEGILWSLESRYQPPDVASLNAQGIRQVVVLTGGGFSPQHQMLSSAFPHASMYRFVGGMELCARLGADCKLIFSGSAGRGNPDQTTALTMRDVALVLEPERRVDAEARSNSTGEHPGNVRPFVGEQPFVLVTSAIHMPRSMNVFEKAGLKPVPYPVDYLSLGGPYQLLDWFPSVDNLWNVQVAMREYLALIYYSVQ